MGWGMTGAKRDGRGGGGSDTTRVGSVSTPSRIDTLKDEDLDDLSDFEIDALLAEETDAVTKDSRELLDSGDRETVGAIALHGPTGDCGVDGAPRKKNRAEEGTAVAEGSGSLDSIVDAAAGDKQPPELRPEKKSKEHGKVIPTKKKHNKGVGVLAGLPALLTAARYASREALSLVAIEATKNITQSLRRPKQTAVAALCTVSTSVAGSIGHSLLVSSLECFAPTRFVLCFARIGAGLAGVSFVAKHAKHNGAAKAFVYRVLPASALRKTKVVRNATIRLLHAVSPVPLRTVFGGPPGFKNAPAGAFSFLASVSKKYLANSARFAVTKRIAAVCFPLKTRTVLYATKVAPMVGAYVVRREIITRTSEKGSVNRDLKWEKTHVWGSEKIKTIVLEHGGFFTKIGQIMATAEQMMPVAYINAFSQTLDANPPVPFAMVKRKVTKALVEARARTSAMPGTSAQNNRTTYPSLFEATFSEFDETPAATASIAQVHFARLRKGGQRVAVKVVVANIHELLSDLRCASQTANAMRFLNLDCGADFPTVFAAYADVVEEEFDLQLESEKMREFAIVFSENGLQDKIKIAEVHDCLSTSDVLVMERCRGVKLLTVLNKARATGKKPRLPNPNVAAVHQISGGTKTPNHDDWSGLFHTMHKAWGVMLLRHGHFHCDPHPGNFILQKDGRLAILDWGQTQSVVIPFKQHVCRLVLCMANEHHTEIAEEVRSHSTLVLANPTTEALSALCFAYFDTRRSPLAEINLMDLSNSPFLANRITRNTREGFNIVRCVFLFRGMMKACQVEASMVEVWESDARASLVEMNLPVPSLFVARGRRFATRAWLGAQKALNVGAGARLNTLQAFVASASASSSARDSQARRGSVREGLAVSPGTPRRMRSASW